MIFNSRIVLLISSTWNWGAYSTSFCYLADFMERWKCLPVFTLWLQRTAANGTGQLVLCYLCMLYFLLTATQHAEVNNSQSGPSQWKLCIKLFLLPRRVPQKSSPECHMHLSVQTYCCLTLIKTGLTIYPCRNISSSLLYLLLKQHLVKDHLK